MWKADEFLVIAHGTAEEVAPAKAIVDTVNPSRLDVHASVEEAEPPERLTHATSYPRGGAERLGQDRHVGTERVKPKEVAMRIFTASIIAGSLMLVGGLPAAGQSSSPAAPVPLAAGNETTTDRDSYTHRATGEMQDWQQKVQDFGEKAKAKGQEAGDATATAVNSAWARTQAAGRKLQEAGADGWEGAKASYEQATHKLADAWDKVRPEDK